VLVCRVLHALTCALPCRSAMRSIPPTMLTPMFFDGLKKMRAKALKRKVAAKKD
jgi:hypothetical protein